MPVGLDGELLEVLGAAAPPVNAPPTFGVSTGGGVEELRLCTPAAVIEADDPAPDPPVMLMLPLVVHKVCVPCEMIRATAFVPLPPVTLTAPLPSMV